MCISQFNNLSILFSSAREIPGDTRGDVETSVTTSYSVIICRDGSWSDVDVWTWSCTLGIVEDGHTVSVTADIIFCDYYCVCLVSVFGNDISYKPSCCLRFLWYDYFHLLTAVANKQQQKKLYVSGMWTEAVGSLTFKCILFKFIWSLYFF